MPRPRSCAGNSALPGRRGASFGERRTVAGAAPFVSRYSSAMMLFRRARGYSPPAFSRAPRVLFAVILITAISQFFRASAGVLAPEITRDLALSPEALGLANAAFFISLTI